MIIPCLILKITNINHHCVWLEWNKPQNILEPLFKLQMNENSRHNVIIYRGFHNYFHVNNLYGDHSYEFKLRMELNDIKEKYPTSMTATIKCTTKNDSPSITTFQHSVFQNLPLLFREFLNMRSKDINVYNELGECGLSKACAAGHNDMVLTMLQNGADVNLPNIFTKMTPLMIAAYYGHCDVIQILAHNDADATIKDIHSKVALHYAVDGSQNNAVKMLLEEKWSNVNSVDSNGWTPLMRAVLMFIKLDVIKTLVDYGSDLSIKDINGQDVWQLAHLSNNWKALKFLLG